VNNLDSKTAERIRSQFGPFVFVSAKPYVADGQPRTAIHIRRPQGVKLFTVFRYEDGHVWVPSRPVSGFAPLGNTPTAATPTTAPAGVCVTYSNGARSFHPGFSLAAGKAWARQNKHVGIDSVRDFEIRQGRRVIIA
jgi:hypothetical protein